jgi:prolyl oligopeptidase
MARRRLIAALALVATGALHAQVPPPPPASYVDAQVDLFHGTAVPDPFRWLEDVRAPWVRAWFEAQDAHARRVLDAIPSRAALRADIARLLSASDNVVDAAWGGDRIFYLERPAGSPSYRLMMREGLDGAPKLVLDPARYRTPAEAATIEYFEPAPNGRRVAVAVAVGGSEAATLRILDADRGTEVGAPIPRADFGSVAWRFDSAVLWYLQLADPGPASTAVDKYRDAKVWMRSFGADGASPPDVPVFGRTVGAGLPITPDDVPQVVVSPVSSWALGIVHHGVAREKTLFVAPLALLKGPSTPWRKVVDRAQGVESFTVRGEWLYLRTNEDAPRYKLLRWSLKREQPYRAGDAEVVLPEGERILARVALAKDALYVVLRDAGVTAVERLEFNVKLAPPPPPARGKRAPAKPAALPKTAGVARTTSIALPFAGSAQELVADPLRPGALVRLAGWIDAPGYYAIAPKTGAVARTALLPRSPVDFSGTRVTRVRVASHDGVEVPLTIVSPASARDDGRAPVLIEAYGAYGYSLEPRFRPATKAWLDRGGIVAYAHVRGGGELGRDWHVAGQKARKSNSSIDLVACARWLAARRIASPGRIAITGGSAGGLVVLNAMLAEPALFRAVVSEVGFHDAIRSEVVASGPANVEEFGSVATPEGFRDLLAMSPYANAKDGVAYPAVLFTAGYNDPRVEAWDPGKMAARLQAIAARLAGGGAPVLLRTDFAGGHGGDTLDQQVDQYADLFAFVAWRLGVD